MKFSILISEFSLLTCIFTKLRGFELVTSWFEIVTRGFELAVGEIELGTCKCELAANNSCFVLPRFNWVFLIYLRLRFRTFCHVLPIMYVEKRIEILLPCVEIDTYFPTTYQVLCFQ